MFYRRHIVNYGQCTNDSNDVLLFVYWYLFKSIKCPVKYIPVTTYIYFPISFHRCLHRIRIRKKRVLSALATGVKLCQIMIQAIYYYFLSLFKEKNTCSYMFPISFFTHCAVNFVLLKMIEFHKYHKSYVMIYIQNLNNLMMLLQSYSKFVYILK